jgi:hypothetical protein
MFRCLLSCAWLLYAKRGRSCLAQGTRQQVDKVARRLVGKPRNLLHALRLPALQLRTFHGKDDHSRLSLLEWSPLNVATYCGEPTAAIMAQEHESSVLLFYERGKRIDILL